MAALFGQWSQLQDFRTIEDVVTFYNLDPAIWTEIETHLGSPGGDLRLLSALPPVAIRTACNNAQGPLTAIQSTQVGLVWRMSRRVMAFRAGMAETEFTDIDLWNPRDIAPPDVQPRQGGAQPSGVKERVLKMSSLIDTGDESELLPPKAEEVDRWVQNFISIMGSPPDDSEEPTGAQLAALSKKVFVENLPPYTDFSVWVPFERRMSKVQRCRTFTPLGDGSYLQRELPGPPSFLAWKASWAVFRTAALMLNICSLASLDAYFRHMEKLITQWPHCWGLIYAADDLARSEKMAKVRRRLTIDAALSKPTPTTWDPNQPWNAVFTEMVAETSFWAERVHHPAAAWVASGGKGAPVVASENAILGTVPGGHLLLGHDGEDATVGIGKRTQANRDRRQAKKKRLAAEREELAVFRKGNPGGKGRGGKGDREGPKGRGKGGKSKGQSGNEICFSWASNSGPCAGLGPGAECKCAVKRQHKCRICLSPSHRDDQCTGA